MSVPTVKILTDLPNIGIPNDPIVLYNGKRLMLCYEISHSDGAYAVIKFDAIEYMVTPINDEGLGKHKYAKYGLKWYEIHEIDNIEELTKWKVLTPKYWVFCFKDRTVEILGKKLEVVETACDSGKLRNVTNEFINEYT
jgi:hypothetical protein